MLTILTELPGHTQSAILFILALTAVFHLRFTEKAVSYGPTILTTSGIFATFVAIAMGLSDFNAENVQEGVPALLNSLKTAFWASVFGVGGALTLKFRHYFLGVAREAEAHGSGADGEVTAADLSKQLGAIQQALVGSDDSTLVSQLKLSRQDSNDRLDALKRAQIEALEKLKEMGTAALIDALKDVIRDFNRNLTEQFGENFKQLNDAVGKLVVWQQQYKDQMEVLVHDVKDVSTSMHTASDSYKELVGKSESFIVVARDLGGLLSALQTQKDHLNTSLKALADLLLKASGSLPEIETKVVTLTDQLTTAVTRNQTEIDRTLTKNADAQRILVETLGAAIAKLGTDATQQVSSFGERLAEAVRAAQGIAQEAVTSTQRQASRTSVSVARMPLFGVACLVSFSSFVTSHVNACIP